MPLSENARESTGEATDVNVREWKLLAPKKTRTTGFGTWTNEVGPGRELERRF